MILLVTEPPFIINRQNTHLEKLTLVSLRIDLHLRRNPNRVLVKQSVQ